MSFTAKQIAGGVVEKKFKVAKSLEGVTHLIGIIHPEYTLCGNAFDGDGKGVFNIRDPFSWRAVKYEPINCPECKKQIDDILEKFAQSSVRLRMNREKLAKTIFNYTFPHNEEFDSWEKLTEYSKQSFYKEADAIIAADKEIIERAN